MERFIKGDVVIMPFPHTNLSQGKNRPALVLTSLKGDDVILCQITSQSVKDGYAVTLKSSDFSKGSLKQSSNIRPNRLFTADTHIIKYKAGSITDSKLQKVISSVKSILDGGATP